jgi:hypothetical protein
MPMSAPAITRWISRSLTFLSRSLIVPSLFFVLCMLQLWTTRYVPSLDGPQHLFNAHVLAELVRGNELYGEFYRVNPVVVGYWTGHFFLGLFKLFLPAWLAEKCFLTAYVLGMFFSFRYLVRSIRPDTGNLMVCLIFPFIFHTYFLLGYYSFSIAAIFFFWAFGYWIRKSDRFGWKQMIVFGAIVMGIFLSHALVFLFFGASFLLFFAATSFHRVLATGGRKTTSGAGPEEGRESGGKARAEAGRETGDGIRTGGGRGVPGDILSQAWRLVLAVLPAVVLWIIYLRNVMAINSTVVPTDYTATELVKNLFRIRQLVGFHHELETPAYRVLFVLIALLSLYVFLHIMWKLHRGEERWIVLFNRYYAWAWISLLFLLAYFLAPDRISAGNLTHRFGVFFFLSLVVLLAAQRIPPWAQMVTVAVLLGVMAYTRHIQHDFYVRLNGDIGEIREMTPYMEEGTTVLSINTSDNWIHLHFQLYAVVDKSVVHLDNPQCGGQFPVIWNKETLPECYAGDHFYRPPGSPDIYGMGHRVLQVDYITVFYNERFWETKEYETWQHILRDYYEPVVVSSGGRAGLYRRIAGP